MIQNDFCDRHFPAFRILAKTFKRCQRDIMVKWLSNRNDRNSHEMNDCNAVRITKHMME